MSTYICTRRFNRYREGQQVFEVGAKLQQLLKNGLVKEVKIAVPEELKSAEPVEEMAVVEPVEPVKRTANAKPKPRRRRKSASTA